MAKTMDKEFVTYEQSLALKELGFDEDCLAFYNGKFLDSSDYNFDNGTSKDIGLCVKAPLKQQVFRFFREKYGIQSYLTTFLEMCSNNDNTYHVIVNGSWYPHQDSKDYEKAEDRIINKLIELAKQQDNG
jgi:hypothetical protein